MQVSNWEMSEDPYRLFNTLFFELPAANHWIKEDGKVLRQEQKPLDLLTELIKRFTHEGDIVLDPFGGTGSTAVAACMSGRRYLTGDVCFQPPILSSIFQFV